MIKSTCLTGIKGAFVPPSTSTTLPTCKKGTKSLYFEKGCWRDYSLDNAPCIYEIKQKTDIVPIVAIGAAALFLGFLVLR